MRSNESWSETSFDSARRSPPPLPPHPPPAASWAANPSLGDTGTSCLPGAGSPSNMFRHASKKYRRGKRRKIILWFAARLRSSYVIYAPYPSSTPCKKYFKTNKNITLNLKSGSSRLPPLTIPHRVWWCISFKSFPPKTWTGMYKLKIGMNSEEYDQYFINP